MFLAKKKLIKISKKSQNEKLIYCSQKGITRVSFILFKIISKKERKQKPENIIWVVNAIMRKGLFSRKHYIKHNRFFRIHDISRYIVFSPAKKQQNHITKKAGKIGPRITLVNTKYTKKWLSGLFLLWMSWLSEVFLVNYVLGRKKAKITCFNFF